MDLALNNLQRLICHKTKQTKPKEYDYTYLPNLSLGQDMTQGQFLSKV